MDGSKSGGDVAANGIRQLIVQQLGAIAKALSGANSVPIGTVQSSAGVSAGYAPVTVGGKTYVVQIFNPS